MDKALKAGRKLALVAVALLAMWAAGLQGQKLGGGKHFKLAENYGPPDENQVRSILEADAGQQLEDGTYLLTGVRVRTFLRTGEQEMFIQAPQCVYDPNAQSARSAGPMSMQSADDKFSIAGEGFLWLQTNSTLFVSNRVHTTVQPELLESSNKQPRESSPAKPAGLEIFSEHFNYDGNSGLGVYEGAMRVTGTNLNLTGQTLTVVMPRPEPGKPAALEKLVADRNVVLDYTNVSRLHATGQRAVYTSSTGLIRVTGQPAWRADQREGSADELIIDRTNKIFEANGGAFLRIPGQSVAAFNFLSASNSAPAKSGGTSNQLVEIRSERYRFETNRAVFRKDVRVRDRLGAQTRGTMDCSLLTAAFSGSNQLQWFVAETNVLIVHEDARLTGERAVYNGTNGILELTGNPSWQAGPREGKGEIIRVNTQTNEMAVIGKAWMRFPAEELASSASFGTNNAAKPAPKPTGNEFAEISCQEYTVRADNATFRGAVYSTHPQLNVTCESMDVAFPPAGAGPRTLTARQKVVFDMLDEKGQKYHGIGQTAFYTNGIVAGLTNDTLTLVGNPATVQTTNTTFRNPLFILDRAKGVLFMPGAAYQLEGKAKAPDTNVFRSPKK